MKKHISRLLVTGVACFALFLSASAQVTKHTPEERSKMMADRMKSQLNLTDEQYSKVYDLNLSYMDKMKQLREQPEDKEAKKEKFKTLRLEQRNQLNAILTDDQKTAYREMHKEKRKGSKDRRGKKVNHNR